MLLPGCLCYVIDEVFMLLQRCLCYCQGAYGIAGVVILLLRCFDWILAQVIPKECSYY